MVSTNLVGYLNSFNLKLKKSHLSLSNSGEGNEFMADEFRFENEAEAIKIIKSKLGIIGCKDLKADIHYNQSILGGKVLSNNQYVVYSGDLRYNGQGLHSLLIGAIKKMDKEKEKTTTVTKDFLADNKRTSTKSSSKDFLANSASSKSNSSSSKDFLASGSPSNKTSSKSNDFLSSGSGQKKSNNILAEKKDSKSDFLDDKTNSSDYKIDYKNGTVGVISKSGKILIPYKKWQVLSYHNGIAKVKVFIESQKCHCYSNTYFEGNAYKVGYVDKTGSFIDGYQIEVTIDKGLPPQGYIKLKEQTSGNYDEMMAQQKREREAEQRRKVIEAEQKRKREKCSEELNSWKRQMESKY